MSIATSNAFEDTDAPPIANARTELQETTPKAAKTLVDLLDAEDERVRRQSH